MQFIFKEMYLENQVELPCNDACQEANLMIELDAIARQFQQKWFSEQEIAENMFLLELFAKLTWDNNKNDKSLNTGTLI